MTEETENGNESIDKLEGSLLATRLEHFPIILVHILS